jgi:hypothetical protein
MPKVGLTFKARIHLENQTSNELRNMTLRKSTGDGQAITRKTQVLPSSSVITSKAANDYHFYPAAC